MKKILAVAVVLVMALALTACAPAVLGVESDNDGVHAVAKNGAEGSGTGNITIKDGYGLCINHIVEKGSFHVKATDKQGTVVFDEDITDNIADLVEVNGEFDIVVSAKGATGTVDIIAYDIEAQAEAEAKLPSALSEAGVSPEVASSISSHGKS